MSLALLVFLFYLKKNKMVKSIKESVGQYLCVPLTLLKELKAVTKKNSFRKWLTLFILCLAGGVIYQLPYLRESYYVVMVDVFEVSNTQLGVLMSAFGIVNLLLYIPGGILADRISYKKLIPLSLILTSFVGFYYATFPSFMMLIVIHMVFAVTTVFTFWATLIKAVKLLGDSREQGKLFGFLEGGRGLTATIVALLSVLVFKRIGEGALGLRGIIIFYSLILFVLGVLAYFVLDEKSEAIAKREPLFQGLSYALKIPAVWYASGIIFSAYSINGGLTYLTPYLTDVFRMSVSLGATVGIIRTYGLRIGGGPLGGMIADRIGSASKFLLFGFTGIIITTTGLIIIPAQESLLTVTLVVVLLASFTIAMVRGVYFAPIDEMKIPNIYVGVAAGIISLIGYIPDIFIYTLYGTVLDNYPGKGGYKILFGIIVGLAVMGLVCSVLLSQTIAKQAKLTKEN